MTKKRTSKRTSRLARPRAVKRNSRRRVSKPRPTTARQVARVLADMRGDDEWMRPDVVERLNGWLGDTERGPQEIADELNEHLSWEVLADKDEDGYPVRIDLPDDD